MPVNTCSSLQKRRVSHTYYPFYESPNGADVLLRRDATWLENQEGYNRTAIYDFVADEWCKSNSYNLVSSSLQNSVSIICQLLMRSMFLMVTD